MSKYNFDEYIKISQDVFLFDLIQQNIGNYKNYENANQALHKLYKDLPYKAQDKIENFLADFAQYARLNALEGEKCTIVAKHFKDYTYEKLSNTNLDLYILFDIFVAFILYLTCLAYSNDEYALYLGACLSSSFISKYKYSTKLKLKHAKSIGAYLKYTHQGLSKEEALQQVYYDKKLSIAEIVYTHKQVQ